LLAVVQTHQDDHRALSSCPAALSHPANPWQAPGSFSHLGTLPRLLLTGWAVPGMGSEGPGAPSSGVGSDSRGMGSGAAGEGGDMTVLDMYLGMKNQDQDSSTVSEAPFTPMDTYLATSTSAADGETVCSSSPGSR
jgi:hypothetical protein